MRKGDWMQTYTGLQYWPIDPRSEEVRIEDIAHGLSLSCRYNGHCLNFYSVAEHSVHMAKLARPEHRKWALLHDASEAYITDIPRPLKPYLDNYRELEDLNMRVICDAFGMDHEMPAEVKELDNRILLDEQAQNMNPPPAPWNIPGEPLGIKIECWTPKRAEKEFLTVYRNCRGY